MQRRDLLKLFALAPLLRPGRVRAADWERVLVLVELRGGNDGLNTLVPFTDPAYYRLRPRLALNPKSVLPLERQWGLNGAMEALQPAWYDYEMAVVHGVGYPASSRSHFRSIAVWESGSDTDDGPQEGWIARQFAKAPPRRGYVADMIQMGGGDRGPLAGPGLRHALVQDPIGFVEASGRVRIEGHRALDHLLQVRAALDAVMDRELLPPFIEVPAGFPRTAFGQRLGRIARLMEGENGAPVYKVTLDGFDTHTHQRMRHDRLLRDFAEGVAALRTALKANGMWERTLVVTYSEFGRAPAENATGGTDHGTAAPHFLLGGQVQGGLYGNAPSLERLDAGQLRVTTDFRRLYATVIEGWWNMPQHYLPSGTFEPIRCLRG